MFQDRLQQEVVTQKSKNTDLNLSHQKYQKAHLHDGVNKYARLEKPPVNTLGDIWHAQEMFGVLNIF
jgi:hypothetical protein